MREAVGEGNAGRDGWKGDEGRDRMSRFVGKLELKAEGVSSPSTIAYPRYTISP
jgi:hypothetical protein